MLCGCAAGMVTGLLHTKLKIPALLSGILTMTALYSINLRIAGKANVPIFGVDTLFRNEFTLLADWIWTPRDCCCLPTTANLPTG